MLLGPLSTRPMGGHILVGHCLSIAMDLTIVMTISSHLVGHELIRIVRVLSQYVSQCVRKQLLLFFHGNIEFFDVQVNLIVPI
jgi:hypothetical protein